MSVALQELRQQMLRDIKILSDAQDVPGLLSFLGAYLIHDRDQVRSSMSAQLRTLAAFGFAAILCMPAQTCSTTLRTEQLASLHVGRDVACCPVLKQSHTLSADGCCAGVHGWRHPG